MTSTQDLDVDLTLSLANEPQPATDETPDEYNERIQTWRAAYVVSDVADADYCARRYRQAQAAAGDIAALAQRRKAEIDEWATTASARHADTATFFAGRLEHFHREQRAADPKHGKTIALPNGVQLRSQAGKLSVVVDDEKQAVAWAEVNASSVVVYPDPKIDKTVAAALFGGKAKAEKDAGVYPAVSADGELVPGISIVRSDTTYTIS